MGLLPSSLVTPLTRAGSSLLFIPLTASRSSPTLGEQFAIRSVRKLKVFQLETIPQGLLP